MGTVFDEIVAAEKVFMETFDKGDADALSKLYTEDCKLLVTGGPTLFGRKYVATIFGYLMGINRSVVLTTEEVEPANPLQDMVFERGKYDFTRKEGEQGDIGKYVVVWQRIDGQWYLYTDIMNSNLPPE